MLGHPIRDEVADLSTRGEGTYYTGILQWWDTVRQTLHNRGLTFFQCHHPHNTTSEGRGTMELLGPDGVEIDTQLIYTWYRMRSGRWEIICYLS